MSKLALLGGERTFTTPLPEWPVHDEQDESDLVSVLRGGKWWLYAFPRSARYGGRDDVELSHVEQFERDFAAMQEVRHCLTVNSGTSALMIALDACGIGPGDEVITTPYTFVATSSAIFTRFALPVYADIDPETYNLDPRRLEEAITPRTKAILVVHFGGEIGDMDAILALARKHSLRVIEDAAQAPGAMLEGNRGAGGIGDVGIFSFQASKVMTAGEGGACTTQDDTIAERLWSLRNCGRTTDGLWYEHHRMGHNFRMTEFQAVVLRGQLRRFKAECSTRNRNYARFCARMASLPGFDLIKPHPEAVSRPLYLILMRFNSDAWDGVHRDQVVEALAAEGVPATAGYAWPTYRNPVYATMQEEMGHRAFAFGVDRFPDWSQYAERCPVAERACTREAIWLPHHAFLGDGSCVDSMFEAFEKVYRHRGDLKR